MNNYSYRLINEFSSNCTELQWKTYILHVFGYSHDKISRILSLHEGSSRNIVSKIHNHFLVNNKDDLITILYESGLAVHIANEVENIIVLNKQT